MTNSITASDFLVQYLCNKSVDTIFSISGAGNLAILDAIGRAQKIKVIFSHHEQAAVMEAQGYARVSGKPGVVLLTTGGGISNGITGLLSAHMDSIPVFVISGNESSFHVMNYAGMRAIGVQGFDSVQVIKTLSKSSVRVIELDELPMLLEDSWHRMTLNRAGPVFIDFPMDLQRKVMPSDLKQFQEDLNPDSKTISLAVTDLMKLAADFAGAQRPLLYIGNGCRKSEDLNLLKKLIEDFDLPYALSWSAIDLLPSQDSRNIGRIGIYGDRAANIILQRADFILTIGTRLAIPQMGYDRDDFGRKAKKWVVDIDPQECQKFHGSKWRTLNCSAQDFLQQFSKLTQEVPRKMQFSDWHNLIAQIWAKLPRRFQSDLSEVKNGGYIHSIEVIEFLNSNMHEDAIVVTDVGAGLLTGHYMISPTSQRVFTSQGLGEMGFGLPGAIGAFFARPSSQLICLNTDGGIMFNLQEMQLISHHNIPLKLFIFNNSGYGMIKTSQENLFGSRQIGSGLDSGISFPNFEDIAKAFKFKYVRIKSVKDLNEELTSEIHNSSAVLFEVIMSPTQKYLPRLGTKKLLDGSLVSPPIEDMDPLLPLDELRGLLGYEPSPNSIRARLEQ
jgi:acetolactate synthase-1/2/3 large subunit